jgi:ubiquinone/menaquinone biosynthesis C-methylase UbiE
VPTREETRHNYDRLSWSYDLLAGTFENRHKDRAIDLLAIRSGEAVLEIGPGTGYALARLARAVGETGKAYGLELSPRMLERARDRIDDAGLEQRAGLVQGDAADLPFPDGRFDVVFASFVLELFSPTEVPRVLAECRRVLRPQGRIGVVSLSAGGARTLVRRLYESSHDRWPKLIDCRPILAAGDLTQAGFEIVDHMRRSMWGLAVDTVIGKRP